MAYEPQHDDVFRQLNAQLGSEHYDVLPSREMRNGVRRVVVKRKKDGETLAMDLGVNMNVGVRGTGPVFTLGSLTGETAPAIVSSYVRGYLTETERGTNIRFQGFSSFQDLSLRIHESFTAKDQGVVESVEKGLSASLAGHLSSPPVARLPHNAPQAMHQEMLARVGFIATTGQNKPLAPHQMEAVNKAYLEGVMKQTGTIGATRGESFTWTQLRHQSYFPSKRGGLEPYADVVYSKYAGQPGDQGVVSSEVELLSGLKGMGKRSIEYGGLEVHPYQRATGPGGAEVYQRQQPGLLTPGNQPGYAQLSVRYPGEQSLRSAEVRNMMLTPTPFAGASLLYESPTANARQVAAYGTEGSLREKLPGVNLLDLLAGRTQIQSTFPERQGTRYGEGERAFRAGTYSTGGTEFPIMMQKGVAPFAPSRSFLEIPEFWDPQTGRAVASEEFGQSTRSIIPQLQQQTGMEVRPGTIDEVNLVLQGFSQRPGRTRGGGWKAGIVPTGVRQDVTLAGKTMEIEEVTGEVKGPSTAWSFLAAKNWEQLSGIMGDWASLKGTPEAARLNKYFQRAFRPRDGGAPDIDLDRLAKTYRNISASSPNDQRFRGSGIGLAKDIFETVFQNMDVNTPEGMVRNVRNWQLYEGAIVGKQQVATGPIHPEQYEQLRGFAIRALRQLPGQEQMTEEAASQIFEQHFQLGGSTAGSGLIAEALRGSLQGQGSLPGMSFTSAESTFAGRFATPMVADDIATARTNLETQLALSSRYPEFGRALHLAINQEGGTTPLQKALTQMVGFASFTKQAMTGEPQEPVGAETLDEDQMLKLRELFGRQDVTNEDFLKTLESTVKDPWAMIRFGKTGAVIPSASALRELSYNKYADDIGPLLGRTKFAVGRLLKDELSLRRPANYDWVTAGNMAVKPLFEHVERLIQGEGEVAKHLFSKETPFGFAGRYQLDLALPSSSMYLQGDMLRMVLGQSGLRGRDLLRGLKVFDTPGGIPMLGKRDPLISVESLLPMILLGRRDYAGLRGETGTRAIERNPRTYGYAYTDLALSQIGFGDLDADLINSILGIRKEGRNVSVLPPEKLQEINRLTLEQLNEMEAQAIPNQYERDKSNAFVGSFGDYFAGLGPGGQAQQANVVKKGMGKYGFFPIEQVAARAQTLASASTIGMGTSFNIWRQNIVAAALQSQSLVGGSRGMQALYQPYLDQWNLGEGGGGMRLPSTTSKFYAGMKGDDAYVGYSTPVKGNKGIPEYNRIYAKDVGRGGVTDFMARMVSHATAPIREEGSDTPRYITSPETLAFQFARPEDQGKLLETLQGVAPDQYGYAIQKYHRGLITPEQASTEEGMMQYEMGLMDLPIMQGLMSRATSKAERAGGEQAEAARVSLQSFRELAGPERASKWSAGSTIHDLMYRFPTGAVASGRFQNVIGQLENPAMVAFIKRVLGAFNIPLTPGGATNVSPVSIPSLAPATAGSLDPYRVARSYQDARRGGYTGTLDEYARKLSAEQQAAATRAPNRTSEEIAQSNAQYRAMVGLPEEEAPAPAPSTFEEQISQAVQTAAAQQPLSSEEEQEYQQLSTGGGLDARKIQRRNELSLRRIAQQNREVAAADEAVSKIMGTTRRRPKRETTPPPRDIPPANEPSPQEYINRLGGQGFLGGGSRGGGGQVINPYGGGGGGGNGPGGGGPPSFPPGNPDELVRKGYILTKEFQTQAPEMLQQVSEALGLSLTDVEPLFMRFGKQMAADPRGTLGKLSPEMTRFMRRMATVAPARRRALAVLARSDMSADDEVRNTLMNPITGQSMNELGAIGSAIPAPQSGINPLVLGQAEALTEQGQFRGLHAALEHQGLTDQWAFSGEGFRERAAKVLSAPEDIRSVKQAMFLRTKLKNSDVLPAQVRQMGEFGEAVKGMYPELMKEASAAKPGQGPIQLPTRQLEELNTLYAKQAELVTKLASAKKDENFHEVKSLETKKQAVDLEIRKSQGAAMITGLQQSVQEYRGLLGAGQLDAAGIKRMRSAEKELVGLQREQLVESDEEQVGPYGRAARRLLGGFGLMYARSVLNFATGGMGYGQGERAGLEGALAAGRYQALGISGVPYNQQAALQNQMALSGQSMNPMIGLSQLSAQNPGLRDVYNMGVAGIGAWGFTQYAASTMPAGDPWGRRLTKAAPYIGLAAAGLSTAAEMSARSQDPTGMAWRMTAGGIPSPLDYATVGAMSILNPEGAEQTGRLADVFRRTSQAFDTGQSAQELMRSQQFRPQGIGPGQFMSTLLGIERRGTNTPLGNQGDYFQSITRELIQRNPSLSPEAAAQTAGFLQTYAPGLSMNDPRVNQISADYQSGGRAGIYAQQMLSMSGMAPSQIYGVGANGISQIGQFQLSLAGMNLDQGQRALIESGLQRGANLPGVSSLVPSMDIRGTRGLNGVGAQVNYWQRLGGMTEGQFGGYQAQANAYVLAQQAGMSGVRAPQLYQYEGVTDRQQLMQMQAQSQAFAGAAQNRLGLAQNLQQQSYRFGNYDLGNQLYSTMTSAPQGQEWAYNRALRMEPMTMAYMATQGMNLSSMPGMRSFTGQNIGGEYAAFSDIGLGGQVTGLPWGTTSFQLGNVSGSQMAERIFGNWQSNANFSQAGIKAGISGQSLLAPIRLPNGQTISSVGGTMGMNLYQDTLQYQQQMAQIGIQNQSRELQFAFTTGVGLDRYNNTIDPRTGKPFGNLGATGGFWGLEDRSRQMNYRQQEWQFGFQERQMEMGARHWNENFGMNVYQSRLQRGWTREDWGYQDMTRDMQWGWKQEDFQEEKRFMTGRQRKLAERQQRRDTTMHNLEEDQIDTQRGRQETLWKIEEERFKIQKKQHEESLAMQEEQLEKFRAFFAERKKLEEEQIKLQRAYFIQQNALQKESAQQAAHYAQENLKLRQTFNQLMIATELTKGQLNTITDDGFEEMRGALLRLMPQLENAINALFQNSKPIATQTPWQPGALNYASSSSYSPLNYSQLAANAANGGGGSLSAASYIPIADTNQRVAQPISIHIGNEKLGDYVVNQVSQELKP